MENKKKSIWDKLSQRSYLTVLLVCLAASIIGFVMVLTDDYGDSGGFVVIAVAVIVNLLTVGMAIYRTKRPGR